VKAQGATYKRVHVDIALYMRVHIIQRYNDAMKEKGKRKGSGRCEILISPRVPYKSDRILLIYYL